MLICLQLWLKKTQKPMNIDKSKVFNVPNKLSAARLVISIIVCALIPLKFYWAALVLFVIAAGTDWLDGWYARKYNMVTKLGRVLDPFCDKVLICGTFILLAVEMNGTQFPWWAKIAGWMAVVVVARELLVTVLRSMIEGAGGDFSAKMAGKLKMWFQCIAVVSSLLALAMAADGTVVSSWLLVTIGISAWVAVISTLQSGWNYVVAASEFVLDQAAPDSD